MWNALMKLIGADDEGRKRREQLREQEHREREQRVREEAQALKKQMRAAEAGKRG